MIKGGIADKLGNIYEAKWLVRCFIDVVADEADWIKFEGIGKEFEGFEFAIKRREGTEWHQTKITAPRGNWTLNALNREGIFKAFARRLKEDKNSTCYLVTQDNSKNLKTLTKKARIANSSTEFVNSLSKDQKLKYTEYVKSEWNVSDENAHEMLSRIYAKFIPESEIDSLIRSFGDRYFQGNQDEFYPILRNILEQNFNKKLDVKQSRMLIRKQTGLVLKEWSFDPTIKQKLVSETKAYLDTYTPFGMGGKKIEREQSKVLLDKLVNKDNIDLILLTGQAGSGKSGIIRAGIEELLGRQIPCIAFRADHFLSCESVSELGVKLTGRSESPIITLKGTFPDSTSILFIDQVDAISEVSGRQGGIREVIFRLIDDAYNFRNVKIVVSCRKFDFESDSRLKRLKDKDRINEINIPFLDWEKEVKPLLKEQGFETTAFTQAQKMLLQLPINLSIFLEIDKKNLSFNSRSSLHERLLKNKQDKISRERDVQWSLIEPLQSLSNWMSNHQKLTAPFYVLDEYSNALNILCSEGLIVSSNGQVNFFHESFFDYVYARAFLTKSKSVVELLTAEGSEQHLFRRTQVRQILEALRKYDSNRYFQNLKSVLRDENVRYHIKVAISQWLSTIEDPTAQEFEIISSFNEDIDGYHQFFRRAIFSSSAWFYFLHKNNWVQTKIEESENCREPVLRWFSTIKGDYPDEIADLLSNWWRGSTSKTSRLLKWFGHTNLSSEDHKLINLCETLIKADPEHMFGEHRQISMLIHSWDNKSVDGFGKILKSLFKAWFDLYPGKDPFQNGFLEAFGAHSLTRVSDNAPMCLLEGSTEFLLKTVDLAIKSKDGNIIWSKFNSRTYAGNRFGFDKFLGIYRSAIQSVAKQKPEEAVCYLDQIDPHKHESLMHLHLETIKANPSYFGDRLKKLTTDKLAFKAGWNGAQWYSFAHAYKKSLPYLSQGEKAQIENHILNYRPKLDTCINVLKLISDPKRETYWNNEKVISTLKNSGFDQWCILETIGDDFLYSELAKSRLAELRRKFSNKNIPAPNNTGVSIVPSPIRPDKVQKMSDEDWLSAIEYYDNDPEKRHNRNIMSGGARQLAGALKNEVKNSPKRFIKLGLKIPYSSPTTYMKHILWGLGEIDDIPNELLVNIIKYADKHPESPFSKTIVQLIQKHPSVANNSEILSIIINYALNGSFENNLPGGFEKHNKDMITIDSLIQKSMNDYAIGYNSLRGYAWVVLGSILWEVSDVEDIVWEALELALERESEIYVRCCILKSLIPMYNSDKKRFSQGIRQLIDIEDGDNVSRFTPLLTNRGLYILNFIFNSFPELAHEIVTELLENEDNRIELIGSWIIYRESFRKEEYVDQADTLASKSIQHERLLASLASKAIKWAENRERVKNLLKSFFFHGDSLIRETSAKVFRNIPKDEIDKFIGLADTFVKSPAFFEHSSSLFGMIEKANCDMLAILVEATEKLIKQLDSKNAPFGNKATDLHQVQNLLKKEYSNSESNTEIRARILDLIDEMFKNELYGVSKIVEAHDRV